MSSEKNNKNKKKALDIEKACYLLDYYTIAYIQGHSILHLAGVPLLRSAEQEGVHPRGQPALADDKAVSIREAVAVHGHQGKVLPAWNVIYKR